MKNTKLVLLSFLISVLAFAQNEEGIFAKINTNKGEILLQLEYQKTPMTVANFISLAEGTNTFVADKYKGKRFYDGLKFHRVIPNFMIQGGDPLGTGAGNPGYKFKDEFDPSLKHNKPGTLSMANSGPTTNGSQFFITHKDTPWLDGKHTVFGYVIKGQDVVNSIEKGDKIISISIIKKGIEAKKFKADNVFSKIMHEEKIAKQKKIEEQKKLIKNILKNETKAEVFDSGLKIYTIEAGLGAKPKSEQKVKIHYTGYLRNGEKFDSSKDRNIPFETIIGVGQVIKGWDEGVQKLRVGTKAILYIPANLAWGKRGAGKAIPPNTDVIFLVELLDIID